MAHFEIFRNGQKQKDVEFVGNEMTIGRSPSAELCIHDMFASRNHARVFIEHGLPFLEDLGTGNGTFVNGRREYKRPLHDGDRIELGSYVLIYRQMPDEDLEYSADTLNRTIVDPSIGRAVLAEKPVEATSVVGPGVLARMRLQAEQRLGPHVMLVQPGEAPMWPLKHATCVVGSGDRCQIRLPSMKREKAVVFEKDEAGGIVVRKLSLWVKLHVDGEWIFRKRRLTAEAKLEIEGVALRFHPGHKA